MSSNIKDCNYRIQGESETTYYNSVQAENNSNWGTIFWNLIKGIFWSFFTLLFLVIFAITKSYVILGFAGLFAIFAIWDFYVMSTTSTISDESLRNAPLVRPCRDPQTNKVYN